MRMKLVSVGLALVVGSALAAHAAELLKSGPQVGDTLGAFTVVKAAAARATGSGRRTTVLSLPDGQPPDGAHLRLTRPTFELDQLW